MIVRKCNIVDCAKMLPKIWQLRGKIWLQVELLKNLSPFFWCKFSIEFRAFILFGSEYVTDPDCIFLAMNEYCADNDVVGVCLRGCTRENTLELPA